MAPAGTATTTASPSSCDILSGANTDCDGNLVPDACDPALALNTCPDIVVQANTSFGIAVNFPTPIAENGCNAVVTTSPVSGSLFTIGNHGRHRDRDRCHQSDRNL